MSTNVLLQNRESAHVVSLTLNRPAALNAIDMALARELDAALKAFGDDPEVHAIVLTGAGDRAFSAGFDINEMSGFGPEAMLRAFVERDPLMWRVASCPKPIIAALNGITYGAGALIAAGADLRVGGPQTIFRVTATKYGGANATWTLPPLVGVAKAKEILMTGRAVKAAEMLEIGLLNQLVDDKEIFSTALALADAIAENPPEGVAEVKRLINEGFGRTYYDRFQSEHVSMTTGFKPAGGDQVFSTFLSKKPK